MGSLASMTEERGGKSSAPSALAPCARTTGRSRARSNRVPRDWQDRPTMRIVTPVAGARPTLRGSSPPCPILVPSLSPAAPVASAAPRPGPSARRATRHSRRRGTSQTLEELAAVGCETLALDVTDEAARRAAVEAVESVSALSASSSTTQAMANMDRSKSIARRHASPVRNQRLWRDAALAARVAGDATRWKGAHRQCKFSRGAGRRNGRRRLPRREIRAGGHRQFVAPRSRTLRRRCR